MTLQLPYGETMTAEYTTAEVKSLLGSDVVVIGNLFYFNHNEYAYKQFCKDAGYAHFNKAKWNDISEMIKIHYDLIAKLTALKGEL